jgi:hypothetical protein
MAPATQKDNPQYHGLTAGDLGPWLLAAYESGFHLFKTHGQWLTPNKIRQTFKFDLIYKYRSFYVLVESATALPYFIP